MQREAVAQPEAVARATANAEFQAGVPTGAYRSVVDSVAGGSVATDLRIYGRVRLGDLGSALDRGCADLWVFCRRTSRSAHGRISTFARSRPSICAH